MAAPARRITPTRDSEPARYTLLELVSAVSESADSEQEVVATVVHLLRSGRVKLCGTFRDQPIEEFLR